RDSGAAVDRVVMPLWLTLAAQILAEVVSHCPHRHALTASVTVAVQLDNSQFISRQPDDPAPDLNPPPSGKHLQFRFESHADLTTQPPEPLRLGEVAKECLERRCSAELAE